jgi:hypothetical protein
MGASIWSHVRSNIVAYLALFIALGGGAYAASQINGKQIKKHSIPGNRLKKHTVTGNQINESTLARVPSAQNSVNAQNATEATNATNAANANKLGNSPPAGFGLGLVEGGIDSPANNGSFRTPYGVTTKLAAGAGLEAVAPVALNLRDFEARWINGFDTDDTLTFALQVNNGGSLTSIPLCTIVGTAEQLDCRAAGPISIAQGDLYKLELTGKGLEENEQASFAYRAAAG